MKKQHPVILRSRNRVAGQPAALPTDYEWLVRRITRTPASDSDSAFDRWLHEAYIERMKERSMTDWKQVFFGKWDE